MRTLTFKCPGCGYWHVVPETLRSGQPGWRITGDSPQSVTCEPSLLVTSGHYVSGQPQPPDGPCWCTYNAAHPEQPGPECHRCHSFIRSGQIQFLSDCSHGLAGRTVPLPADAKVSA